MQALFFEIGCGVVFVVASAFSFFQFRKILSSCSDLKKEFKKISSELYIIAQSIEGLRKEYSLLEQKIRRLASLSTNKNNQAKEPYYSAASKMFEHGASIEEVMEALNISNAEAVLLQRFSSHHISVVE